MPRSSIENLPPQSPRTPEESDAFWGYTINAAELERMRNSSERAPGGKNRHSIHRDTSVLEGIYEGTYGGEAIVVNYKDRPEYYDAAVERVLDMAKHADGSVNKSAILESVFETVKDMMQYSLEGTDKIFEEDGKGRDGKKIGLSVYLEDGVGVCRHQALFAAAILERLKALGIVRGTASVDRNINWDQEGNPGGHAWMRYTNSGGEVIILDAAQDFLGTLDESFTNKNTKGHGWDYVRPEEREDVRSRLMADVVVSEASPNRTGVMRRIFKRR